MRTVKKPEIRRQEILDGAMGVFLEKGYEKATISDIARALGISQGLCYRYFATKEEIYEAVLEDYAASIVAANQRLRPRSQAIRQWLDSIPELIKGMLEAERQASGLYPLLHSPKSKRMHLELCVRVGEKLLPIVTQVLEDAKARGEIAIDDCQKTAAFGIYGEIGLLVSGEDCGEAIRDHWQRLLGLC